VLNLPITATNEEIRERYRQLSLVFHPDKQHGKPTQETALKQFLQVQKAYESEFFRPPKNAEAERIILLVVLSDPVTRYVSPEQTASNLPLTNVPGKHTTSMVCAIPSTSSCWL
jgi:hypothetical protein